MHQLYSKETLRGEIETSTQEYMNITKLHIEDLEHRSSKYISNVFKQYDNKKWLQEKQKKTSLTPYIKLKMNIEEEQPIYDNHNASTILFRAKT